jgi:hypothetical protein
MKSPVRTAHRTGRLPLPFCPAAPEIACLPPGTALLKNGIAVIAARNLHPA